MQCRNIMVPSFFQINNDVCLFLCLVTNLTLHMFETTHLALPMLLAWNHSKPLTSKFYDEKLTRIILTLKFSMTTLTKNVEISI